MKLDCRKLLFSKGGFTSVIGGSISACHGARDDLIAPKCYPYRFFRWRNSVFPHPAAELTDGAMRQTDSRYFVTTNLTLLQ
ncbi:hypothetical protein AX14_002364 [Amanita brunnescens Koide BX004]|nr:hypothetical protein AX14_002364 [Amanita brunnescens Koide BX004]